MKTSWRQMCDCRVWRLERSLGAYEGSVGAGGRCEALGSKKKVGESGGGNVWGGKEEKFGRSQKWWAFYRFLTVCAIWNSRILEDLCGSVKKGRVIAWVVKVRWEIRSRWCILALLRLEQCWKYILGGHLPTTTRWKKMVLPVKRCGQVRGTFQCKKDK